MALTGLAAVNDGCGGSRTPNQSAGRTIANRARAVSGTALPAPMLWLGSSRRGPTVNPAALAPLSAKLMARPRCRSKYIASALGIAAVLHPAHPTAITAAAPNNCHG